MQKVIEIAAIDAERFRVAYSDDRCGARPVVEERQLAEKVSARCRFEHDATARVVFEEDFDLPVANDEKRVAGIAVVENGVSRFEADHVELRCEDVALLVVEQLEKRNFRQKLGLRTFDRGVHRATLPGVHLAACDDARRGKLGGVSGGSGGSGRGRCVVARGVAGAR
jgi:hypothetical protein